MSAPRPIGIAILGSTGSIGTQTLDVIKALGDQFRVVAIAARSNATLLAKQAASFQPDLVVLEHGEFDSALAKNVEFGESGLLSAATHPDAEIVVVATSGHAAILPTIAAIRAGKTIALANKETIVCAGELIVPMAAAAGVQIRPIDSEHSAIWQSLGSANRDDIRRLILTASGGPFRESTKSQLRKATVQSALAHPTWAMGGKITIDSATLMNKGLELIEAHWLFDVPYNQIEVVIHPESIIHSLVEFNDGSQIAQLSWPDMRLPIQYALTFPRHVPGPCRPFSLSDVAEMHFYKPDIDRFPALRLARQAGIAGGSYPTVLSAADEIAVDAFLSGRIGFTHISEIVERTLTAFLAVEITSVESILAVDLDARRLATEYIDTLMT